MDQPPAVVFTAFADVWPRATETEIGAAQCAIGARKNFNFDFTEGNKRKRATQMNRTEEQICRCITEVSIL